MNSQQEVKRNHLQNLADVCNLIVCKNNGTRFDVFYSDSIKTHLSKETGLVHQSFHPPPEQSSSALFDSPSFLRGKISSLKNLLRTRNKNIKNIAKTMFAFRNSKIGEGELN